MRRHPFKPTAAGRPLAAAWPAVSSVGQKQSGLRHNGARRAVRGQGGAGQDRRRQWPRLNEPHCLRARRGPRRGPRRAGHQWLWSTPINFHFPRCRPPCPLCSRCVRAARAHARTGSAGRGGAGPAPRCKTPRVKCYSRHVIPRHMTGGFRGGAGRPTPSLPGCVTTRLAGPMPARCCTCTSNMQVTWPAKLGQNCVGWGLLGPAGALRHAPVYMANQLSPAIHAAMATACPKRGPRGEVGWAGPYRGSPHDVSAQQTPKCRRTHVTPGTWPEVTSPRVRSNLVRRRQCPDTWSRGVGPTARCEVGGDSKPST